MGDGKGGVLVAMSGGVDSSVSALLLSEAGYAVHGVSFHLHDGGGEGVDRLAGEKRCCSSADVMDAARVAKRIGIPFDVVDLKGEFRRGVVDDFVSAYREGRTPNPCIRCNERVKFRALEEMADRLGIRRIATGHYARVERGDGRDAALLAASDRRKDQSYALFPISRGTLSRLLLPLGGLSKPRVRDLARLASLPVAEKAESQDICFVPGGDPAAFLEEHGISAVPGEVVDGEGRILGEHGGIHRFTVGQRKGIGIASAEPLYVLSIDPRRNRVTVGRREELSRRSFPVSSLHWLEDPPPEERFVAACMTRYRRPPVEAEVTLLAGGRGRVDLRGEGVVAAPGQAAVFYRDERVLGGGWIEPDPGPPEEEG
jgi:tRNA-specific 2-thiouridylase